MRLQRDWSLSATKQLTSTCGLPLVIFKQVSAIITIASQNLWKFIRENLAKIKSAYIALIVVNWP